MEKLQVEFTDRYDGNPPSWLQGCFECEAMGAYPVKAHLATHLNLQGRDDMPDPVSDYERAYIEAVIAAGGSQDDCWYFVPCPHCDGTARVSWLRTIARIPRWLWKGIRFTLIEAPRASPHISYRASAWLGFKCAFLVDLELWKP